MPDDIALALIIRTSGTKDLTPGKRSAEGDIVSEKVIK